uniref:Uncharacterized protein n=1 Tax=Chrysotila carterae TaxID=13221 RepID=A0A7S4FA78_CHRCT
MGRESCGPAFALVHHALKIRAIEFHAGLKGSKLATRSTLNRLDAAAKDNRYALRPWKAARGLGRASLQTRARRTIASASAEHHTLVSNERFLLQRYAPGVLDFEASSISVDISPLFEEAMHKQSERQIQPFAHEDDVGSEQRRQPLACVGKEAIPASSSAPEFSMHSGSGPWRDRWQRAYLLGRDSAGALMASPASLVASAASAVQTTAPPPLLQLYVCRRDGLPATTTLRSNEDGTADATYGAHASHDARGVGVGTRLLLEDGAVRVWEFHLAPGEECSFHVHTLPYVFTNISDNSLTLALRRDGRPAGEPRLQRAGETVFVPAEQLGGHGVRNVGTGDFVQFVIELKE